MVQADNYQGLRFQLYDVLARQVINLKLTGEAMEVNRNNLSGGIYCWQINDGMNVLKAGKLILK